jgi:hypothetical protein
MALVFEIEKWKQAGGHYRKCDEIFDHYLKGLEVKKIARKVRQPESIVRLVIRRITRRARYALPATYQAMYRTLQNTGNVQIKLVNVWL